MGPLTLNDLWLFLDILGAFTFVYFIGRDFFYQNTGTDKEKFTLSFEGVAIFLGLIVWLTIFSLFVVI